MQETNDGVTSATVVEVAGSLETESELVAATFPSPLVVGAGVEELVELAAA